MRLPLQLPVFAVFLAAHFGVLHPIQGQERAQNNRVQATIDEARKLREYGQFPQALATFQLAAREAHQAGDIADEAKATVSVANLQGRLFNYGAALTSAEAGRELAIQAGDNRTAGSAANCIATIYGQLGDLSTAEKNSRDAVQLLEKSHSNEYLAGALIGLAEIQVRNGDVPHGIATSQRAINVAHAAGLQNWEATAWDLRGISLLVRGNVAEAEKALDTAHDMRAKLKDKNGLAITLEHLAELELKKGSYNEALRRIDEAFASGGPGFKITPQYYPIHIRALILLNLGRTQDALTEFRRAVDSARKWRQGALPGDATNTQTVAQLHEIYQDYAELAAELALSRKDTELSRSAFETLAENRAASLREQLALSLAEHSLLPPEYFKLLSELQAAQGRVTLGQNSAEDEAKLENIRLQLTDLENKFGLKSQNFSKNNERNPHRNSLKHIQDRLGDNDLLLSFCLGSRKSFVWVVTVNQVNLYELPKETDIAKQAAAFSADVRGNRRSDSTAKNLSEALFGKLPLSISRKRNWLITPDGALLDAVPFADLPQPTISGSAEPISSFHTLRTLPSELLLLTPDTAPSEARFVGVGDPVYNSADSRGNLSASLLRAKNAKNAVSLARLPGSAREISMAVKASGMPQTTLLLGAEANGAALRDALAKGAELLHFAVHVVSPQGRPEEAALALSLTSENVPELLTREAIAAYRVPGTVVVLSGCASDQGKSIPGAGLIGLGRAWLLAGASAVVVSAWPTPDDSGRFFSAFYSHLQALSSGPLAQRAAAALQQAQLDMRQSGGYRSSPSFWAAYSILSKE